VNAIPQPETFHRHPKWW